jgi:hypothetical protein
MRTTGVRLVAELTQYKREMHEGADATRELKAGIDDVATTADHAGMLLGNNFRDSGHEAKSLRGEIEQTEHTLAGLAGEFARASNASDRLDITKNIRKQQGELRQLLKIEKLLPTPAEIAPAGEKIGRSLFSSLSEGFQGVSKAQFLAPLAAAAAPVVGAVISAAVIGGAGVGGVIGGVLLAARDPRVKSAGTQLGQTLLGDLQQDAAPFVAPLLASIGKVEARFNLMGARISQIFSQSSDFLGPLTNGILDAVDGIMRGVGALISNAGPVIKALGQSFSILGDSVGKALTTISGDSEDAASALTVLAKASGQAIVATGYLVRGLTEVYGVISFLPSKISGASVAFGDFVGVGDRAHKSISGTVTATAGAVIGLQKLGSAASAAVHPVRDLDKAQADAARSARSLYASEVDAAQATADATKTIKENGKQLSLTSAKGRENRQALISVASAYVRVHDDAVAANGEGRKSAQVAATNQAAFVRLAEKAGYSASQARNLARSLGLIPTRRETQIRADTSQAEAKARRIKALLAGIHSRTVSVNVLIHESQVNKVNNTLDRLGHRASGGPVKRGSAYVVGEHRPEVFVPDRDGTIIPSIEKYSTTVAHFRPEWNVPSAPAPVVHRDVTLNLQFSGPVGSQLELQTWLTGAVDDLKRKGRI